MKEYWKLVFTALWGYSSVMLILLIVFSLIPGGGAGGMQSSDSLGVLIFFGPVTIFFIAVAVQYKKYKWNWWRTLLECYSLSVFILLFLAFILPATSANLGTKSSSADNILGALIFIPVLVNLVVFGRDYILSVPPQTLEK